MDDIAVTGYFDSEKDYGLIRPSLIKQLRSILDQYPDNGQILKELVQNAEDAGATKVTFIYDEHSYGIKHLHHADMAKFQGPALYAYNNATFTEQDWMGIRMLQDSVKETDSLKIGRFGLGFKSVLHLTDLPSVLSGERLFIIDPHETYFQFQGSRTSGYMWNLRERKAEIRRLSDQFTPFLGICGVSSATFDQGTYSGTLFRFPLRQVASELSSTEYDRCRMNELFGQFELEAPLLLLFLKNVEEIELCVREAIAAQPRTTYKVSLAAECLDEVRRSRQTFTKSIKCVRDAIHARHHDISVTYPIIIETIKYGGDAVLERRIYRYLVNEYFACDRNVSRRLTQLYDDSSLSLMPLVGVAMPLGLDDASTAEAAQSASTSNVDDENRMATELKPIGQIFCFLPLPMEEKSASGLPVHVNGYFSISQNRRHLKWPSAGQKIESDPMLLWNQCLLREVLPLSYVDLLLCGTRSAGGATPRDVLSAIPNLVVVDEKWQTMLEPFFHRLFDLPIFYSRVHNGCWNFVTECVFDCTKEKPETRNLLIQVLLDSDVAVADVRPCLLHALGAYSIHSPETIMPRFVREVLRSHPAVYTCLNTAQKLLLLAYILKDDDFRDLDNLELLLLADGIFTKFRSMTTGAIKSPATSTGRKDTAAFIYLPSIDFPAKLLPGLEGMMVSEGLDVLMQTKFVKLAQKGVTQIQMLSKESIASLLPRVIPKPWYDSPVVILSSPSPTSTPAPLPSPMSLTLTWLRDLWIHLRTHHPSDLSMFSGLPILPISSESTSDGGNTEIQLVPLVVDGCTILRSAIGTSLDTGLVNIIGILGGHVVDELPEYARDHAAVIGGYVKIPIAADTVEVIYNCCRRLGGGQPPLDSLRTKASDADMKDLVNLVATLQPNSIDSKLLNFLRFVPMFKCNVPPSSREVRMEQDIVQGRSGSGMIQVTKKERITEVTRNNDAKEGVGVEKGRDAAEAKRTNFVSVHEVGCVAPVHRLPLAVTTRYLDVHGEDNALRAATLLGARHINITTMLREVFRTASSFQQPPQNSISCGYSQDLNLSGIEDSNMDVIGADILKNFYAYRNEDPGIAEVLSNVPFVLTADGKRARPTDVFDPEIGEVRSIIGAEKRGAFPGNEYASAENLQILRHLGLKSANSITGKDILAAMLRIENISRTMNLDDIDMISSLRDSSISILAHLDRCSLANNNNLFLIDVDSRPLTDWARTISWVAPLIDKPSLFPSTVNLHVSETPFVSPDHMMSVDWALVAGAVVPVCAVGCSRKLTQALGWTRQPSTDVIVQQLAAIVCGYRCAEKAQVLAMVMSIYEVLSSVSADQNLASIKRCGLSKWIWHGDGFASTDQILLTSSMLNLVPYRYGLPSEMSEYSELFRSCGATETITWSTLAAILHEINNKHNNRTPKTTDDCASTLPITPEECQNDVQLALNILNHLAAVVGNGVADDLSILVLCRPEFDRPVVLLPVKDCTYCDVDWLQKGFDLLDFDEKDGVVLVHPQLPMSSAQALGVPTLMSRMLNAEEFSITSYGQSEPLTNRLHKLLEDYTDGLAIPKEIIQNADDAGATEVKFLYDERQNLDAMRYLIDEGMRDCQGEALWAYNNAIFTDTDFENITRLGGATKEAEFDKIGKFGLGFNAVYNLTDVPSFVTRDTIVIFDPHTTHLGKGIRDRGKPGIKINVNSNRTLIRKLPDQFRPYEGIFGCNLSGVGQAGDGHVRKDAGLYYDGTLFRFPLRTREQAARSEISNLHYDRDQVTRLIDLLRQSASHLLLFTQNVSHISFYHLGRGDGTDSPHSSHSSPSPHPSSPSPTLLFSIDKTLLKVVCELTPTMNWRSHLPTPVARLTDNNARELVCNTSVLRAASEFMAADAVRRNEAARSKHSGGVKAKDKKTVASAPTSPPTSSIVVKITVCTNSNSSLSTEQTSQDGAAVPNITASDETAWLISSAVGSGLALELARQTSEGYVPAGAVACPLEMTASEQYYIPKPFPRPSPATGPPTTSRDYKAGGVRCSGRAFCYLPLPVATGLPVHINATFALHSDRRQLSYATEDDKRSERVDWNVAQLRDTVTTAYVKLLQDICLLLPPSKTFSTNFQLDTSPQQLLQPGKQVALPSAKIDEFDLSALWPTAHDVDPYFLPLVRSFYSTAVSSPPFSSCRVPMTRGVDSKPHGLLDTVFLETALATSRLVGSVALERLSLASVALGGEAVVGVLSDDVRKTLINVGEWEVVEPHLFTIERFYLEIVFPSLGTINSAEAHNSLVQFALQQRSALIDAALRELECIPTSANGETPLRRPQELVHPSSVAASLYDPEDGRFPHGRFRDADSLVMLERLGMRVKQLSWLDVLERCQSLSKYWQGADRKSARDRLNVLMVFIDRLTPSSTHNVSPAVYDDVDMESVRAEIRNIPFLCPLTKPRDYPLKWTGPDDGSEHGSCALVCANDLFTRENARLVSSTAAVVDDNQMSYSVKDLLGLRGKKASLEQVVTQLEHALAIDPSSLSSLAYEELRRCVDAIFTFLQNECASRPDIAEEVATILAGRPCILYDRAETLSGVPGSSTVNNGQYLYAHQVAFDFPYNCAPYLYGLPTDVAKKHSTLLGLIGVKQRFAISSYISALQDLKAKNEDRPLSAKDLDMSIRLVTQLNNTMKTTGVSLEEMDNKCGGSILVPNTKGVLQPAASLCYNDCPWISETVSMNFTHPDITFQTSECLGVRTKRQEALSKHARGIPFGQKERLTNSLRRILTGYPFDHEILKELVQNADDAGATEIHFVTDLRYHADSHVFENHWKPLQGPALCVYNDCPFTDRDLAGIQRLGEGSKVMDPTKTGQYGIGFSSVYHLTDAPSLLTSNGRKQSLCVFDPHCRYVPGATPAEPGMQYDNVADLRSAFPDVFGCYLEDLFPGLRAIPEKEGREEGGHGGGGGTMFRFPLRTRSMADTSEISKDVVTPKKIQTITELLKREIFEILLFVNHLRQISVSDIDPVTGRLLNTYTVKVLMSNDDVNIRRHLSDAVVQAAARLKERRRSGAADDGSAVPVSLGTASNVCESESKVDAPVDAIYTALVTDNTGNQEKWMISQRLGFNNQIPDDLSAAIDRGDLSLLPRGGVACLVERREHGRIAPANRPSRVYCFLPLPTPRDLELPVHVNGHFALGYENRRTLWVSPTLPLTTSSASSAAALAMTAGNDVKQRWNEMLCKDVISPAYVSLLAALRMKGLNGTMASDDVALVGCSKQILDSSLSAYMAFFPMFSWTSSIPLWNILTESVYRRIGENQISLMPSVCSLGVISAPPNPSDNPSAPPTEVHQWRITWLPPKGEGMRRGFFKNREQDQDAGTIVGAGRNTAIKEQSSFFGKVKSWFGSSATQSKEKSDSDIIRDVLLECGFKLIDVTSPEVFSNFQHSGVDVEHMTPDSVVSFFRSYSSETPTCCLGELPRPLAETPFRTEKTLELIIAYCKSSTRFSLDLDGLPLLLTADGCLNQFSTERPVFRTEFSALCPGDVCAQMFIKPTMLKKSLADLKPSIEMSPVFKDFTISDLAQLLPEVLPLKRFKQLDEDGAPVEWVKREREGGGGGGGMDLPTKTWLKELWNFLKANVEHILSRDDLTPIDMEKLIRANLEPLSEWCLIPATCVGSRSLSSTGHHFLYSINHADKVFDSRPVDREIRFIIKKLQFPMLDVDCIGSLDLECLRCLVTTLSKPRNVLRLMHSCFKLNRGSTVATSGELTKEATGVARAPTVNIQLSKSDYEAILKYFCENVDDLLSSSDDDEGRSAVTLLRDLPIFTTIAGDVISLTSCIVYTLPAKIPTNGIDVWQNKSGMVFLERSDDLQPLYHFLGCATVDVIEVYCRFIFQHFEYFSQDDRIVHLHHIYTRYLSERATLSPTISPEERDLLIDSLCSLPFLQDDDSKGGTGELHCASYFHDPENSVFQIMLPACRFAPRVTKMFAESDWYRFLAMLGMVREVTPEMFTEFTRAVAAEGRDPLQDTSAMTKSKALIQHLYAMPANHRDPILADIVDVPFIACEAASPELQCLSPQHGLIKSGQLGYVPFRDAASKRNERLLWTTAHLLPAWADPLECASLGTGAVDVAQRLAMQRQPRIEIVIAHLTTLCEKFYETTGTAEKTTKKTVFRAIYQFLNEQVLSDTLDNRFVTALSELCCLVVDDGQRVVLPNQTVLNLYESDEIKPYLYRLPIELGQYRALFQKLGATDRASIEQYAQVLIHLKADVKDNRMTPNELSAAYRAVRGLVDILATVAPPSVRGGSDGSGASTSVVRDISASCLYLPSQSGKLVDATQLVFNDAPSFYDRVKDRHLQFLFDLQECGIRHRNVDELLGLLPTRLRPAMLNAFVQETLVDSSRRTLSSHGVAKHLNERLRSERFLRAIVRLARHEAYKRGKKLDESAMFSVLDRLSMISVYTVKRLVTHLSFRGKQISGSEMEKACFVEREPGATPDIHKWNIYMRDDADLSQDLLIPLAETVNSLLSGILRDSVLYLLPVLSCAEDQIETRMDQLNIRLDQHSSKTVSSATAATSTMTAPSEPTLPQPGSRIAAELLPLCCWGQTMFTAGEYIGYKGSDSGNVENTTGLIYGVVREELESPDSSYKVYLVDLGSGQDGVITSVEQMYKFIRK